METDGFRGENFLRVVMPALSGGLIAHVLTRCTPRYAILATVSTAVAVWLVYRKLHRNKLLFERIKSRGYTEVEI